MRSRRHALPVSPSRAPEVPPRPARLIVLPDVTETIRCEVLAYAPAETGGVLVGPPEANTVAALLAAGPRAERGHAHLVTDPDELQPALDHAAREHGWTFLGYWHSHPGDFDRPSWTDLTTAFRILGDRDYGVAAVLLPISIIKNGEVRTRWYRVDGDGCAEVPIELKPSVPANCPVAAENAPRPSVAPENKEIPA